MSAAERHCLGASLSGKSRNNMSRPLAAQCTQCGVWRVCASQKKSFFVLGPYVCVCEPAQYPSSPTRGSVAAAVPLAPSTPAAPAPSAAAAAAAMEAARANAAFHAEGGCTTACLGQARGSMRSEISWSRLRACLCTQHGPARTANGKARRLVWMHPTP